MAWPTSKGWNQHLDKLNASNYSNPVKVSIIQIEPPCIESAHVRHVHPYWQICLFSEKIYTIDFDDFSLTTSPGDIVIIPPQNWHYIRLERGADFWGVKFDAEGDYRQLKPGILKPPPETEVLAKWLFEIITGNHEESISRFILLEHLIAAMIDLNFLEHSEHPKDKKLLEKSRLYIEEELQKNKSVRVKDLAEEMGLTPVYLTRVFKKEFGIPLKEYIDQARFDIAKKLLNHSGLNISEVAEEMGFDDVFRFSRFFKRMSGQSPRQYLSH